MDRKCIALPDNERVNVGSNGKPLYVRKHDQEQFHKYRYKNLIKSQIVWPIYRIDNQVQN